MQSHQKVMPVVHSSHRGHEYARRGPMYTQDCLLPGLELLQFESFSSWKLQVDRMLCRG